MNFIGLLKDATIGFRSLKHAYDVSEAEVDTEFKLMDCGYARSDILKEKMARCDSLWEHRLFPAIKLQLGMLTVMVILNWIFALYTVFSE